MPGNDETVKKLHLQIWANGSREYGNEVVLGV
jgi:hypothetical protein